MQIPMSSTVWCAPVCRSPVTCDVEVEAAVAGEQVEHVVEEADAGRARARAGAVERRARARRSVSPVSRSISAVRAHGAGFSRTLHRRRVELEALGARDRRAGGAPARRRRRRSAPRLMRRRKWRDAAPRRSARRRSVGSMWLEPAT